MRKLASIQRIESISGIEGADAIESARVLGWNCVVKKGEFKEGDVGVYFEIDSYLPIEPRFEFLRKSSYKKNEYMGEGMRIRTMKLRGTLSQGLFLPISDFSELKDLEIGTDVSALLNVKKWDMPEFVGNLGIAFGEMPYYISKTDEIRIQSKEDLIEALKGRPYYITTKLNGTSTTIFSESESEDLVGVCGRNYRYKKDAKTSPLWNTVINKEIDKKLIESNRKFAIQGEYCGEGIQSNNLRLKDACVFAFNIIDLETNKRLHLDEFREVAKELGVDTVPIEEEGDSFNYNSVEELLERARGKYDSGVTKEGIVIRSKDQEISFKVINNDFLLKEK